MVTKENQIKFYTEELKELEFEVKKIFNSTGLSLFQSGDVYVGQYSGFDEKRGNVFVDIPIGEQYHSPRLDQKLTCFTIKDGLERPTSWKDITYSDLLKDRNRTETKIVNYTPSEREGWITMLTREMDSEFIDNLQYNQIIAFGPTIPPFEYLQNLKEFSESLSEEQQTNWNKLLGFKYKLNKSRNPLLITEEIDIANAIIKEVEKTTIYLFQGPPGTGKTHQIADIVSRLVLEKNSVLITALTNKAAVEVCEKPFFSKLFEDNRVSKLPLSSDERTKFPKLLNAKNLIPSKGHLILTTYYQFSRIWQEQTQTFDYVIVEEASQAYLTTIAAACKVGKRVIVVGDPKQILPMASNKNYKSLPDIEKLINGMNTICQIDNLAFYRKVETRRLTTRSTEYTNNFYQNTIISKSLFSDLNEDISKLDFLAMYVHPKGGPSLIQFSNHDNNVFSTMLHFLKESIDDLSILKNNDIAVLTPYIETLTHLQQKLKSETKITNYLIESVDRVQGLDVDYCFYVIPKSSSFSFNINRFNVATSRAKKQTFILVEKDFDRLVNLPNEVTNYLAKLKKEFSFTFSSNLEENKSITSDIASCAKINSNTQAIQDQRKNDYDETKSNVSNSEMTSAGIELKILGKIDLSRFEKPKKEIIKDKKNLYIIDTNVFVDYPDIISKIDKKYQIILSAKVIDELDYLKISLTDEQKKNVQKALKSINNNLGERDIKMDTADVSLLPIDFNKKSPDNLILSVALKYKNENPIMLTSDNGLQIKSKGLGITTITLKDFIKR